MRDDERTIDLGDVAGEFRELMAELAAPDRLQEGAGGEGLEPRPGEVRVAWSRLLDNGIRVAMDALLDSQWRVSVRSTPYLDGAQLERSVQLLEAPFADFPLAEARAKVEKNYLLVGRGLASQLGLPPLGDA